MPLPTHDQAFLALNTSDQSEALEVAATASGRPAHLLEKDIWVVWILNELFSAPFGQHLVFKGGTSLSKAYDIIDRFSEDIDLTYDVTAFIPELAGECGEQPDSASQAKRWTKTVRKRLPEWVRESALPIIQAGLERDGLAASLEAADGNLLLRFSAATAGTGYVQPVVQAEFGGRSTGLPAAEIEIGCDAAGALPDLRFPVANVRAMSPKRTFWEKATAIHVYCLAGQFRGRPAFARHWHDLERLHAHGFVADAIDDRPLANAVASHKALFFVEKAADGERIDYAAAVGGQLRLVPEGGQLDRLRADYDAMIRDGLLYHEAKPFEQLLNTLAEIEALANDAGGASIDRA